MPGVAVFRGRRTTSPEGMEIHVPLKSRGSKAGLGAMRVSPRITKHEWHSKLHFFLKNGRGK